MTKEELFILDRIQVLICEWFTSTNYLLDSLTQNKEDKKWMLYHSFNEMNRIIQKVATELTNKE